MSQPHTWRDDFPDDYAVPEVLSNDPELCDQSWHNDVCPSFGLAALDNSDRDLRLWVHHPNIELRESMLDNAYRFVVTDTVGDNLNETIFFETDDLDAAIAYLKDRARRVS